MKIHSILFMRSKQWLKTSLVYCTYLRDFLSRTRISRSAPYHCFKNLSCLPYHCCGNVKLEVSFHKPDGLLKRVKLLQQLPYFRQSSVSVYTQKRFELLQAGKRFLGLVWGVAISAEIDMFISLSSFFTSYLSKMVLFIHTTILRFLSLILNETVTRLGHSS